MNKNELTLDLLVEKKSFINDYEQNVEYFEFSIEYEERRYKLNVKSYEKNLLKLFLNQEFSKIEDNEKLYELKVLPKKNLIKEVESAYHCAFFIRLISSSERFNSFNISFHSFRSLYHFLNN